MRAYAEVVPSIAEAKDINAPLYYLRDKHVMCQPMEEAVCCRGMGVAQSGRKEFLVVSRRVGDPCALRLRGGDR